MIVENICGRFFTKIWRDIIFFPEVIFDKILGGDFFNKIWGNSFPKFGGMWFATKFTKNILKKKKGLVIKSKLYRKTTSLSVYMLDIHLWPRDIFFYLGPTALGKKIYPLVIGGYLSIYTSKEVVFLYITSISSIYTRKLE